jgi:hypothetical protein
VRLSENKLESSIDKFSALLKSTKKIEWTIRFLNEHELLEFQSYLKELSRRKKFIS